MAWNWKGVGDVAKKLASAGLPLLGTVLGGPLGGVAGAAVASILGVDESDVTPENMLAWSKDPDKLIKLKELEANQEYRMAALALQTVEMGYRDVADARNREVETTKATGKRDYNLYVLAWVIISGVMGLIALLFFYPVPPESSNVLYILLGTLAGGFTAVIQYFFGSSKSSQDKTALLSAQQK